MFAIQFTARYLDEDNIWASSTHVAYFPTPEDRAAFASLPFIVATRYPEDDLNTSDEHFYD